ncbi:aspartic proteinase nepenthesin-1-like [Triticum dicoccoides]|uniref:aspartic proteinase nepenthesin-1-like n=1 Tax=Triticum dicoccoides TaxID=85692 RepID=UPI00188E8027|nr:aspartic proteinase nepenthesin-1-like [Triticum dicoccoides]XP_037471507.1 aspartic proteinase nepenthesin-1-like [Triticum dicoccoides]
MELDTHALALLPLVLVASLAMFLQPAVATHGMPRPSGGFSLRLVPSAGWNSTMHVDGGGFLHLNEQAATTALRPHVHGPRGLTYSVATTVGTGRGRRTYDLVLDTVSSLTWMQCLPIAHPFPQMPPPFNREISTSFRRVPHGSDLCHKLSRGNECEFRATRLDGAHASGVLGTETFTFADDGGRAAAAEVGGVVFGCAHTATGFHGHGVLAGVLGLGKLMPSLIWTRLRQHWQDGRFSYCLFGPTRPERHGFLRFGADVPATGHMKSTNILYMRWTSPDFSAYFVKLLGVSVAGKRLAGPPGRRMIDLFQCHKSGGRWYGGCLIDPGTGTTTMTQLAYNVLEHAVEEHVKRLGMPLVRHHGYRLCFSGATQAAIPHLPTMTLHFEEGGEDDGDLVIRPQQLFVFVQHDICLAVVPSEHMTIIGAMQQVDTRFVYDITAGKIHFAPERCSDDTGGPN